MKVKLESSDPPSPPERWANNTELTTTNPIPIQHNIVLRKATLPLPCHDSRCNAIATWSDPNYRRGTGADLTHFGRGGALLS